MSTPETPAPPAPPAPSAPPVLAGYKAPSLASKLLQSLIAAVTSPTAVAKERSFAAFIIVRVLLAAGASASLVGIIAKLVGG